MCRGCNADVDSAQNALETCTEFAEQRAILTSVMWNDHLSAAIVRTQLADATHRKAVMYLCEKFMTLKQWMVRSREKTNTSRYARRRTRVMRRHRCGGTATPR